MTLRPLLRPWCWVKGHRRGELARTVPGPQGAPVFKFFRCPRCDGNERRYKVKAKEAK